jgi:hypothetical protein
VQQIIREKALSENEALKKAAEEYTLGLAKSEPLQVNRQTKTNIGAAQRVTSFKALLNDLDGAEEYTALLKIMRGWSNRQTPNRLKTTDFLKVSREARFSPEETIATNQQFDTWWNWTTIRKMIHYRNAVINIACEQMNFEQAALIAGVTDKTLKAHAVHGVKEFIIANSDRNKASVDAHVERKRFAAVENSELMKKYLQYTPRP